MEKCKKKLGCALGWFAAFAVWTMAVRHADVQAIGPEGSGVGMAGMNRFVHQLTGVHLWLYGLTDWLSVIPVGLCVLFGVLGLRQWIQRKRLLDVDRELLLMGIFYIAVIAAYVFFEYAVVNYRPVLIEGVLEASYPSSTTMLVLCVMTTAGMELQKRIQNKALCVGVRISIAVFIGFMVLGRTISGVHWLSDIIGGVLLSVSLIMLYDALRQLIVK